MRIIGVLLAAGWGKRMGTLKQVLPWGSSTVVASAFDGLARHCTAGMIVVLGAQPDRVAAALQGRRYTRVQSDPDAEMFESIRRGLSAALQADAEAVLLHPADHPVVESAAVERMIAVAREAHTPRAVIPTHGPKGGHPVLIPRELIARVRQPPPPIVGACILDWPGPGGFRAFWEAHPHLVTRIEFPEAPGLILDLDTPDDYRY